VSSIKGLVNKVQELLVKNQEPKLFILEDISRICNVFNGLFKSCTNHDKRKTLEIVNNMMGYSCKILCRLLKFNLATDILLLVNTFYLALVIHRMDYGIHI